MFTWFRNIEYLDLADLSLKQSLAPGDIHRLSVPIQVQRQLCKLTTLRLAGRLDVRELCPLLYSIELSKLTHLKLNNLLDRGDACPK